MAGVAESILEAELSCPVCLSTYQDPVSLGCGHCYCRECITEAMCHQKEQGRSYTCPMCQQEYQDFPALLKNLQLSSIVENYVSMQKKDIVCSDCLEQPSLAVKTCVTCEVSLCQKHVDRHIKKSHLLLEPTASVQERKCTEHDKLLEYYCEQDDSPICVTCYIVGSHKGHNIMTLKQAHEKQLATLTATTSALSDSVTALCQDIDDLHAGLVKITENTLKLSKPLEDLCDVLIILVKDQFQEAMQAIHTNQAQTTSKITAVIKQMEDAKATAEQALKDLKVMSKQPDDLLFIKEFNRSQALIGQPRPQINTMQVVGVEADKVMIAQVKQETTDFVAKISLQLKTVQNVLSQQIQHLVWSGAQRIRVPNPKEVVSSIRGHNLEKINFKFKGHVFSHCSYTASVSNQSTTLTAIKMNEYDTELAFPKPSHNQLGRRYASALTASPPACKCKLSVVIPNCIIKEIRSSKVYCLVDVSKSNDWSVGVINRRSETRYLRWNGKGLSFESDTSLSLGSSKIKKLKMRLDFNANLLGFYDAGHETEMPIIICKCDNLFIKPLNVGFNILDGSLSLM